MTRQAVLVPADGNTFGVRVRSGRPRWFRDGLSWSDWQIACEPGHNGRQQWPRDQAQAILDAALENGWVPDRYHGYVLPILHAEESDAD